MTRGYQQADMSRETIVPKDHIMACLKHFALYGAVEAGKEYNTTDMSKIRMYNQFCLPIRLWSTLVWEASCRRSTSSTMCLPRQAIG